MGKIAKTFLSFLILIFVALASFFLGASSVDEYSQEEIAQKNQETKNQESKNQELDSKAVNKKLKEIKSIIDSKFLYEYDEKEIEEGIYKGYLASLKDIYTEYYTVEEFKAMNEQSEGVFGGVGIEVSGMSEQYIEVIAPIKGTPADRAGIKPGDKITKIDGKEFFAKDIGEAVKVMRGEPGKDVTLTVVRKVEGKDQEMEFTLTREIINVQSVHYKMLENDIAYIHITAFQTNTDKEFMDAFKELKEKGAKKLILDLRNNPGGLLDVTLNIADFLLPEGEIMSVKYRDGSGEKYTSKPEQEDMPMITLINGGSASASEVLSGALKDYNRSEILGEKSFGKGVVQQVIPLGDGTGIKVTVAEYFSPKHNKIHGEGVTPTIEEKLDDKAQNIGPEAIDQDNQLRKAIEVISK